MAKKEVKVTEEQKKETKTAKTIQAEEKVTGESVLFSLKNEKEEKNAPTSELEFGKNK